jgi:hypothetical protein
MKEQDVQTWLAAAERTRGMRMRRTIIYVHVAVVAAAFMSACTSRPSARDLHLPPQIVLPGDAYDLRPENKADGTTGVTFRLHEPFPAARLLARIREALPAPEWQPLEHDWLNADIPSSHQAGWGDFLDGTTKPTTRVHQWCAQRRDAQGDVVYYNLRYVSGARLEPGERNIPDNDRVQVSALWVPKPAADRLMKWSQTVPRTPDRETP